MLRRRFLGLAGGTALLPPTKFRLLGDSILVSSSPLIAEFHLQSQVGRYTPTEDFFTSATTFRFPRVPAAEPSASKAKSNSPRNCLLETYPV